MKGEGFTDEAWWPSMNPGTSGGEFISPAFFFPLKSSWICCKQRGFWPSQGKVFFFLEIWAKRGKMEIWSQIKNCHLRAFKPGRRKS
jgi:hypothetical protein